MPHSSFKSFFLVFAFLFVMLLLSWWLNLNSGSVSISFQDFFNSLFRVANFNEQLHTIITAYRIPKSITAILVGSGLGVAGLLMQTMFRNPLAGPYVLGLSSGASLGVALCILGGNLFTNFSYLLTQKWTYAIAASLGSFIVLFCVLLISFRVRDHMALLIIGLMFASVTSGIVSILSFFASAEALQQYVFWGFGSLGNLSWSELYVLLGIYIAGVSFSIVSIKALNGLQLGEAYAKSMGQRIVTNRFLIISATSLLCGVITAFAGPIAFVGLAIPHITRQLIKTSNHKVLLPAVLIIGAIVMLVCDSLAQLPGNAIVLPINAITALVGAPVILFFLLKNRSILF